MEFKKLKIDTHPTHNGIKYIRQEDHCFMETATMYNSGFNEDGSKDDLYYYAALFKNSPEMFELLKALPHAIDNIGTCHCGQKMDHGLMDGHSPVDAGLDALASISKDAERIILNIVTSNH